MYSICLFSWFWMRLLYIFKLEDGCFLFCKDSSTIVQIPCLLLQIPYNISTIKKVKVVCFFKILRIVDRMNQQKNP
jgi:hypothetical protein